MNQELTMFKPFDPTETRYWIEKVYKEKRTLLQFIAFKICQNTEAAEDCVQEAAMVALETPIENKTYGAVFNYMRLVVKGLAVSVLRKSKVHNRYVSYMREIIEFKESIKPGIFLFYPLHTKVFASINKLSDEYKIALLAYCYSIPFTKMFGPSDGYLFKKMHHAVNGAIGSIRRDLTTGDPSRIGAIINRFANQQTDRMMGLEKMGMKRADIARAFNTSENNVAQRISNRIQKMKKYPDKYSQVTLNDPWYEKTYNEYKTERKPTRVKDVLTEKQLEQVRKLLKKKKPLREISRYLKVSTRAVEELYRKEFKDPSKPQTMKEHKKLTARIIKMRNTKNMTLSAIAKKLGIGLENVKGRYYGNTRQRG
jgi:DNA-directed RNA polymerase specialized sigma24 family protein